MQEDVSIPTNLNRCRVQWTFIWLAVMLRALRDAGMRTTAATGVHRKFFRPNNAVIEHDLKTRSVDREITKYFPADLTLQVRLGDISCTYSCIFPL